MNEIERFCDKHNACSSGRRWALEHCKTGTMIEAWNTCSPDHLLWIATRPGVLPVDAIRRLAISFARLAVPEMKDPRSVKALDVAEAFLDGKATREELEAARAAAYAAAAYAAAYAAATYADYVADAAAIAAAAAARAASDDAYAAARWDGIAALIREHTPNFESC